MNKSKIPASNLTFENLGIDKKLLETLTRRKFTTPTPIQHQVIPAALEGKDVVGIAQTGTGKTLAFGIPMIQRLTELKGQGLILLPTRELALQVHEAIESVSGRFALRSVVLIGGAAMRPQITKLRQNPDLVIATPGRLIDHMRQRNYSLERVSMIVLDEADRMLDIGFQKEITQIMRDAPREKQSMLFSATMPATISKLASSYMKLPLRIEVAPQGTSAQNVEQEVFIIAQSKKTQLLEKVLSDNAGTAIVFSRTKHGAKRIAAAVRAMDHSATEIHSNRSLNQRKLALAGFKSGKYRVLVATDIAARGIDVQNISMVINFDLPDNCEDYVHRIGRTARAGASGKAISFATSSDRPDVKKIERLIRKTLPILQVPSDLPAPRAKAVDTESRDRSRGSRDMKRTRRSGRDSASKAAPRSRSDSKYIPKSEESSERVRERPKSNNSRRGKASSSKYGRKQSESGSDRSASRTKKRTIRKGGFKGRTRK